MSEVNQIKKTIKSIIDTIELNDVIEKKNMPFKMPYSLNDIESCKDITNDKVLKDYDNLVKFKGDTNPKKFCGNKILYNYQFRNLLKCKREKGKTIEEIFDNEELKEKLWRDTIKRNRRDKAPCPSPTDVYEANRINTGAIVFFKSSTAKYIYKKFQSKKVLDFTMGWGGRMLGAMASDVDYIGIDTNTNLKEGYEKILEDIPHKSNIQLIWKSCLDVDYSKLDYDLILTSPPYVNMELYENMKPFENDDIFYNELLIPTMDKAYKYMKDGGKMCINISPKMYKDLTEKYGYRLCDSKEDLRQQLGQNHAIKSQDYIYIWNKN